MSEIIPQTFNSNNKANSYSKQMNNNNGEKAIDRDSKYDERYKNIENAVSKGNRCTKRIRETVKRN